MVALQEKSMPLVDEGLIERGYMPRPFGETTLYTKTEPRVSLDQLILNEAQPRHKEAWESKTLRRQIEVAGGVFEPPLVEPTDQVTAAGKPMYLVDDGHRRVTESRKILLDREERLTRGEITQEQYESDVERYGFVTVEVTDRPLSLDERIRVWLFIHRERKEWTLTEREETANHLIKIIGIEKAADVLGVEEAEAYRLQETYQYASRIHLPDDLQDRTGKDARVTWAREVRALKKSLRDDDDVMEAIYERIKQGRIRNSKDIRVLRKLPVDSDPMVRQLVLDVTKDLVRDIAQPRGIEDPVRATRHSTANSILREDVATSLRTMASAIDQFQAGQILEVRRNNQARKAARTAIERMRSKLAELEELL
jgi:ParB family chromosome partitioning protein